MTSADGETRSPKYRLSPYQRTSVDPEAEVILEPAVEAVRRNCRMDSHDPSTCGNAASVAILASSSPPSRPARLAASGSGDDGEEHADEERDRSGGASEAEVDERVIGPRGHLHEAGDEDDDQGDAAGRRQRRGRIRCADQVARATDRSAGTIGAEPMTPAPSASQSSGVR